MRCVIAGNVIGDTVRTSPAGTWHQATAPDGTAAGALLVDERVDLDRLVAITSRLRTLGLPGVLRVQDLVEHGGRVWLLVADPPEPTLADLLGFTGLDAGNTATILNEVGETLLALHRAGLSHGAVAAGSVVIRADGTALLADWSADGNGATGASDVTGWVDLSRQLASAWSTSPGVDEFLRRVTELARSSGDLAATLGALRSGADNVLPNGFRERRALRAAVTATAARTSADQTVPLGGADVTVAFTSGRGVDDDGTLLIERATAPLPGTADDETIGAGEPPGEPDASMTATQLGQRRIQRAGAAAEAPAAIRRFGPGVPGAVPAVEQSWRAGAAAQRRPRPRGRTRRRLLGLVLAAAAAAAALWWVQRPPLEIVDAAVRVDPRGPGCGGTANIRGMIATNGEPGTITYRWIRSDIGPMAALVQPVPAGRREETVTLQWTFAGEATTEASAGLEILAPRPLLVEARFAYRCPS